MSSWVVWGLIGGVGVLQLPLVVDLVLALVPASRGNLKRLTHKALSIVLITVVAAVSLAAILYFHFIFLHRVTNSTSEHAPQSLWHSWVWSPVVHATFITATWVLAMDNYAHACLIRPPPADLKRRRIKGFDHYCPFTMNIVFLDNYRHFFQFLVLASVGMAYASLVSWAPFQACWVAPILSPVPAADHNATPAHSCQDPPHVSLIFVPCIVLSVGLLALLLSQLWLFHLNKTTAEFFEDAQLRGLAAALLQSRPGRPTKYHRYMAQHWAGPAALFVPPSLDTLFSLLV